MHLKNLETEEADLEICNQYHMIANSKTVECYLINKLNYLKHMYSLTRGKQVAGDYIERLVRYLSGSF